MLKSLLLGLVGLSFALAGPAQAQSLFSSQEDLEIVIAGPINDLVRRAARNTDPIEASLTVAGREQPFAITLEPRGVSRRVGDFCNFPPLRIDFADGAVRGTIFRGQNRIKVVTRCRNAESYAQLTILEYLAYRLYNEITPISYRVRPARITYRDRRDDTQFNILVEDIDDVARRHRRVSLDIANGDVRSTALDAEAATRLALFQFMIGNLDWDMVASHAARDCCHNIRLLAANAQAREGLIPTPYDFDHSGLVNAPYATAPDSLPVRSVRQRYYRGYCRFNDSLPQAIAHFQSRRAALLAVIDGETRLEEGRRRGARTYIESFFEVLDDPRRIERELVGNCR